MTIAIALKVGDGVVLGADSASTLMSDQGVANVYFNAEKICNLRKGLPIGMVTYGLGGIGGRSVTSLAKDLRERFTSGEPDWHLDPAGYTIELVADRLRTFFYDELYTPQFANLPDGAGFQPMGFYVAGFSAQHAHAEVWQVEINGDGTCGPPKCVMGPDLAGIHWSGQPEALNRLIRGFTQEAHQRLVDAGASPDAAAQVILQDAQVSHPAMPIQDAIDLVYYLVEVTSGFVRFSAGAPTVAEPIDIAAITKHERFRWVRRKHYYDPALNPPRGWYDSSSEE